MLKESLSVLLIGVSVVFFGLVCIIGIIYLMSFLVRLFKHDELPSRKKHGEIDSVAPENAIPAPISSSLLAPGRAGRRETVAAVSAAIAEYLGADINGIRIHSIKRTGESASLSVSERRELIAAVSAAIAEEMGTDVSAIRILSIKKAA